MLTILALLFAPVGAYASAGLVTDARCCCPDPKICKCHDHDGRSDSDASMGKCAGGQNLVTPQLTTSDVFVAPPAIAVDVRAHAIVHALLVLDDLFALPPEKPPF